MGTACGGADSNTNETMPTGSLAKKDGPYDWRKIEIADEVTVLNMHPIALKKFRWKHEVESEESKQKAQELKQKEEERERAIAAGEMDEDEEYDDEVPEGHWQCNGGEEGTGFEGGCKSGQVDLAFHQGTEGW